MPFLIIKYGDYTPYIQTYEWLNSNGVDIGHRYVDTDGCLTNVSVSISQLKKVISLIRTNQPPNVEYYSIVDGYIETVRGKCFEEIKHRRESISSYNSPIVLSASEIDLNETRKNRY